MGFQKEKENFLIGHSELKLWSFKLQKYDQALYMHGIMYSTCIHQSVQRCVVMTVVSIY